jgi:hypothetical protein
MKFLCLESNIGNIEFSAQTAPVCYTYGNKLCLTKFTVSAENIPFIGSKISVCASWKGSASGMDNIEPGNKSYLHLIHIFVILDGNITFEAGFVRHKTQIS